MANGDIYFSNPAMDNVTSHFNNKKGIHMAHLNIRSLWNKFDLVRQ